MKNVSKKLPQIGAKRFLVMDVLGLKLTSEEKELVQHPYVLGVILFARNYQSRTQLMALCTDIKAANSACLIMADQEGGRIQRFVEEFVRLPSLTSIGQRFDEKPEEGLFQASEAAITMATDLRAAGLDFSLVPVLDVLHPSNPVVRERAFHADPNVVVELAEAYIEGLRQEKMPAIGKHFPGHGTVSLDSHVYLPVDERALEEVFQHDLIPFQRLIHSKRLQAVMTAHLLFPNIDKNPVTFSPFWLQEILRKQLHFDGLIFSDDMNMQGAMLAYPDAIERVSCAKEAGCDVILFCNHRPDLLKLLRYSFPDHFTPAAHRLLQLHLQ